MSAIVFLRARGLEKKTLFEIGNGLLFEQMTQNAALMSAVAEPFKLFKRIALPLWNCAFSMTPFLHPKALRFWPNAPTILSGLLKMLLPCLSAHLGVIYLFIYIHIYIFFLKRIWLKLHSNLCFSCGLWRGCGEHTLSLARARTLARSRTLLRRLMMG